MLPLTGEQPLLVETVERVSTLVPPDRVLIVTGEDLLAITRELVPSIPANNLLGEPRAASTGPALAWATCEAMERDAEATVLSLHADWSVPDAAAFRATASHAMHVAEQHDVLVTVGISPTRVEVGYGYVELGEQLDDDVFAVRRFVEKPDATQAAALIAAGALWNSGLFAWTASRFLAETKAIAPEIGPYLEYLERRDVEGYFSAVTPIAIDFSHFERSTRIACVPGRFAWDDIGTWSALERARTPDAAGNVLVGETFARDTENSIVWADDGVVVVDGVHDLVIIRAHGVSLITTRERATHLKDLLDELPTSIRNRPG